MAIVELVKVCKPRGAGPYRPGSFVGGAYRGALTLMLGLAGLLAASPVAAQPVSGGCVKEASSLPSINCTANDVALTDIVPGSLVILDDGCTSTSDTVTFIAQGIYELTTQQRFDIGTFISTDGDPNGDGAQTGQCVRDILATSPNPPYVSLDGDLCGDIDQAHSPLTQLATSPLGAGACSNNSNLICLSNADCGAGNTCVGLGITISCGTDADNDGKVDIDHCETWNQPGADIVCSSAQDVKAGSPSKCNCGRLPGACIAFPDDNPCTIDRCQGTCSNDSTVTCLSNLDCNGGTCQNIQVVHIPTPGAACGDPNPTGVCDNPDICLANGECSSNPKPSTTICRASAGQCDVAESCTGSSGACPADAFQPATTPCTGTSNGGACDGTDSCKGGENTCVDGFQPATTICRASAGQCDVAESCTGSSGACPADAFQPATTPCTGTSNGGACDGTDSCKGGENTCVDGFQPATTICRASAGQCDVAESCTGSSGACPADAFQPATTACVGTSNGGPCDGTDSCKGGENTCVDGFQPATTICRASAGQCDVAESCSGSSGDCPADAFQPATTACVGTSNGGACDGTDSCKGGENTCVDGFQQANTICPPAARQCDVAESCTGTESACPPDVAPACEGKIAPTATTCQDFTGGTAGDLTQILYGVKNQKINNVAPGVLFYYSTVTAPASSFKIQIVQAKNNATVPFFGIQQGQVRLYNADCSNSSLSSFTTSGGVITITVMNATPGATYIVGVKYAPGTVVGTTVGASPPTVHYDFSTLVNGALVEADPDGLNLTPKP